MISFGETVHTKMWKLDPSNGSEMEKKTRVDRISNLPWDVLDTILVHLPLRDAVRTSVLSSMWRYKWTGLSQFVFDDKCLPSSLSDKKARWREIMKIIDHVQSNHSGPIEKFKLDAYCRPNHSDLDQWIHFLVEKGIKELFIQYFDFSKHYMLPFCLFSCSQLSNLKLYGCIFKLPLTFKGFNHLKSLHLTQVSIHSFELNYFIQSCPVLERLTLVNVDHLDSIKIHNLNLKYLKIDSVFGNIFLENSPLLCCVDICMIPVPRRALEQEETCNFLSCLHGIERLTLSGYFLKFLGNNNVPARLPTMLNHLLTLNLKEVTFDNLKEVTVTLSILRSCPNLVELHISIGKSRYNLMPIQGLLRAEHLSGNFFNQLKIVRIRGSCDASSIWELIKVILVHSPVLEQMTVVDYEGKRIPESQLEQVQRASDCLRFTSLTL